MARSTPPVRDSSRSPSKDLKDTKDVELLRVFVNRTGTHVDAQWAIHPQLKHDLLPQEWLELTNLMASVTGIVSARFSQVLTQADPEPLSNA
jgi:hypothetical protein